jgi:phosphate starvation-inducible protein PhoH
MSRKQHRGKKHQINELASALVNNGIAQQVQQKKSWSVHDLRYITPKSDNQTIAFEMYNHFDHVFLDGSPGTGKTFIHLYHALKAVIADKYQSRIIIVRSAVPVRDQGFLPGTIDEKSEPYETPYRDACHELLGKKTSYDDLKKAGIIEFMTTGFMRGLTIDNAILILDENQNYSYEETKTCITRTGQNTRVFITGDSGQRDLKNSGYQKTLRVIDGIDSFVHVIFGIDDIVRSGLVKEWIIAEESLCL